MKNLGKWLLVFLGGIFFIGIVSLIGVWWWLGQQMLAVSNTTEPVEFVVERGANTRTIGRQLEEKGIIRNEMVFRLYARYKGLDKKIQAGLYNLDKSLELDKIVSKLLNNPSGISVTLIEGWRREEMALAIEKAFANQNPNFEPEEFIELSKGLEGELFPDTYQFGLFDNEDKIIKTLNDRYKAIISKIGKQGQAQNYNDKELNTIASLIEREANNDQDRKLVAGVLFNRLELGMALQIDATLQFVRASRVCGNNYKCEDWWPVARAEDKDLVSPYNTYAVVGLPPGPISSTGKAVLEAAYNPTPSEFLYYLTDNQGVTHFAVTYDEHVNNVNRYLR